MTPDEQPVLDWLDSLCEQADAHRREGDLSFLNRIASNAGIKHYFDNVHALRSVPAGQWRLWYPSQYGAASMAYQAAQQAERDGQRMTALEQKFDRLQETLDRYLASAAPKKGK